MSQDLKKSPLATAKGLGSAKEGVAHWWMQRVTAVLMIPLALYLVYSFVGLGSFDHTTVKEWLAAPLTAAAMLMFVLSTFYHSELGTQVVVEDYISGKAKIVTLLVLKFLHLLLGIAAALAVIRVALG